MNEQPVQPQATSEDSSSLSELSPQPCILLVEDDRSVRRYLEVTLQRSGYKVLAAADGLEAMKLAFANEIDAVVTDAVMPHLSGEQLAGFLRNHPKLSQTPIILLTGQENKPSTLATTGAINAFLYKPVKTEELTRCLAEQLQRH
jgi:DNA-binding response OmpR family regulator